MASYQRPIRRFLLLRQPNFIPRRRRKILRIKDSLLGKKYSLLRKEDDASPGSALFGTVMIVGAVWWMCRKSKKGDLVAPDYLSNKTIFARFNPYNNPAEKGHYTTRVEIKDIKPELLAERSKLVTHFAGIWVTSREEAKTHVGRDVSQDWNVLARTTDSVILHAAGVKHTVDLTKSKNEMLLEARADVKPQEGVVEFTIKTLECNPHTKGLWKKPVDSGEQSENNKRFKYLLKGSAGRCMTSHALGID